MKTYKITEFSKMLGVSDQTIRNYEKRGILIPHRLPSGHRFYTDKHIEEAKSLGMYVDIRLENNK